MIMNFDFFVILIGNRCFNLFMRFGRYSLLDKVWLKKLNLNDKLGFGMSYIFIIFKSNKI